MRRSLTLIPLLLGLALLASAMPVAARQGIAIGASVPDIGGMGPDVTKVMAAVEAHKAKVDRYPRMWALRSEWGSRGGSADCQVGKGTCAFPTDAVLALHAKGITPIIWWMPVDPNNAFSNYSRYGKIIKGKHNAYIRSWARAAKMAGKISGRPVVIRYAFEAEGEWFPWGINRQDNSRARFIRGWRHVHNQFRKVKALRHVRFLWSVIQPRAWKIYPGDAYVDYVGVTIMNWGNTSRYGWRLPITLVDDKIRMLRRITAKPIIVPEMATSDVGGNKGKWIKRAYNRLYWRWPQVKGVVYLDTDEPMRDAGHPDWRLEVGDNGSGLRVYKALAASPRFQGKIR